jgi:lysophospholipase L1-like esterase
MAKNFPVINNGYNDFEEYLAAEGYALSTGSSNIAYIWDGNTSGSLFRLTNGVKNLKSIDNALYIKSLTISASQKSLFQFFYFNSTSSLGLDNASILVDGNITIPLNHFKKIDQEGFGIGLQDIPAISPNSIVASASITGVVVTKSQGTVVNSNAKIFSVVVTVTNYSGSSTVGTLVVSDVLPIGCNFVSASGTGFTLVQTGNSYTMTTTDVIANNGTKTYTLTVKTSISLDFAYSFNGYSISNDTDFTSRPMVWAGTSITNGTGITAYRNNYTFLLKNWLKDNLNVQSRVVNKAISGSQTNIMEDYRSFYNWYDFKQEPKFLFIEHGVNDVAQSISNATSVSNVTKMIAYYRGKYPSCYIIILAPFPANAYETGLAVYRTSMQTLVNSYSAPEQVYIKYIAATGSVWNAATQGGTYTTDGLHVNAAGRLLIFNAITNYITTNSLTFP